MLLFLAFDFCLFFINSSISLSSSSNVLTARVDDSQLEIKKTVGMWIPDIQIAEPKHDGGNASKNDKSDGTTNGDNEGVGPNSEELTNHPRPTPKPVNNGHHNNQDNNHSSPNHWEAPRTTGGPIRIELN